MVDKTANGRAFRILNIIDEFTRECLSIKVNRKISSQDVIDELFNLFIFRSIPAHIRSDNGTEFTARAVRKWLNRLGVKPSLLNLPAPGRTDILNLLTVSCETNYSTERPLTHLKKQKY